MGGGEKKQRGEVKGTGHEHHGMGSHFVEQPCFCHSRLVPECAVMPSTGTYTKWPCERGSNDRVGTFTSFRTHHVTMTSQREVRRVGRREGRGERGRARRPRRRGTPKKPSLAPKMLL